MSDSYSETEMKSLAEQLRNPSGDEGLEVARMMNTGNVEMIKAAITGMDLKFGQSILELGHGNADHLSWILNEAEFLNYFGLDISETMKAEAERINARWIDSRSAFFTLYDGRVIPFKDNTFHAMMTVNTIYFWEYPAKMLSELHRVLKPGGVACIAFGKKSFMKDLPFVQFGFQLYSEDDFLDLASKSPFIVEEVSSHTDSTISKTKLPVEREFYLGRLRKS